MINRLMDKKRQEEGFTLIEMLIVVIILGILAAVVVFGVSTFREDSVTNACKTDVKSVQTAAEAYKAKTGSYPQPVAGDATATPPVPAKAPIDVLVEANYLKEAPSSADYSVSLSNTGVASSAAC